MSNKISVGILLISTWKYNKFIDSTIQGIRQYFFPNSDVKIYLHTDSTEKHDADVIIPIEHKPWPFITLHRFELFYTHKKKYNTDYLFYLDIDTKILRFVNETILDEFVVTEHSGYKGKIGTPESNPLSTAYIHPSLNIEYICGGFFGGIKSKFLEASKIMMNNIQTDLNNNIIAIWHDESHLNRYYANNKNKIKLLSFEYMYNRTNKHYTTNNPIMMPYHDEEKQFNKFSNTI